MSLGHFVLSPVWLKEVMGTFRASTSNAPNVQPCSEYDCAVTKPVWEQDQVQSVYLAVWPWKHAGY